MASNTLYARGGFPNELDKAIDSIYTDAGLGDMNQWSDVFKTIDPARGSSRTSSEISGLGNLDVVPEGGVASMSTPTEGWNVTNYFTKYGLGFQATEEMIQDELHDRIKDLASSLGVQTHQKINIVAFDILNSGFATHKTPDKDTPYLFSASHYYLNTGLGTVSNLGTTDLSETGLQAAWEYMDSLTSHNGNPLPQKVQKILVTTGDQFKAAQLFKGEYKLGSADRDPLTTNPSFGSMPGLQWQVCYYLTDSDSWFAIGTDNPLSVSFKMKPDLRKVDDPSSGGRIYYSYVRMQAFANRWQGLYGSQGA